MHHSEVSVEGHEREEEDGAVETNEVGTADHLTQSGAEGPLRQMVRGPERQTGGKQEVGEDQVQEEDVGNRAELLILVDDEEDEPVSQVTQDKVHPVEHWDECGSKPVDGLLCTELDGFIDHVGWVSHVFGFLRYFQEEFIHVIVIIHSGVCPVAKQT